MTRQPFESCPRFETCSCNECPLDPLAAVHGGPRLALPGEERCQATRAARERVAVAHGHPAAWAWLPQEARRERRRVAWLALPEEERERRQRRLIPFAKAAVEATHPVSSTAPAVDSLRTAPGQGAAGVGLSGSGSPSS